jgi:hypothetical protein
VLGRVNVRQGVEDAQAAAEELFGELVTGDVLQDRVVRAGVLRAAACAEDLRLTLDLLYVGVLADQPDRGVVLHDGLAQRHVVAHPFVGFMQRGEVGVAVGEHYPPCDLVGKNR